MVFLFFAKNHTNYEIVKKVAYKTTALPTVHNQLTARLVEKNLCCFFVLPNHSRLCTVVL